MWFPSRFLIRFFVEPSVLYHLLMCVCAIKHEALEERLRTDKTLSGFTYYTCRDAFT